MARKVKGKSKKHKKSTDAKKHKEARQHPDDASAENDTSGALQSSPEDEDNTTGTESENNQSSRNSITGKKASRRHKAAEDDDDSEVRDSTATFVLDKSINWPNGEDEGSMHDQHQDGQHSPDIQIERYETVEDMGLSYVSIFEDYSQKFTDVNQLDTTNDRINHEGLEYRLLGILGHMFTEGDIQFQVSIIRFQSAESQDRIIVVKKLDELLEINPCLVEHYITLRKEMEGLHLPLKFKGGKLEIPQMAN